MTHMDVIDRYIADQCTTYGDFDLTIGLKSGAASRIVRGLMRLTAAAAYKIEVGTKEALSAADLLTRQALYDLENHKRNRQNPMHFCVKNEGLVEAVTSSSDTQ